MKIGPSRRLFLGGAAVTFSLPFLPSALWSRRASAASLTPPRRFMAWFVPNGLVMPNWTPYTVGTAWAPTPIETPLEPIRKKMAILTGLDHQATAEPADPPAGHGSGTGCFLNMISVNGHLTDKTRVSLDQVLLPALGASQTLLPSMQLGVQGDNGLCDRASCDFSRSISWTAGTPMPNIYDPQACFDRMFAGYSPTATTNTASQTLAQRTSILDLVLSQATTLSTKLSKSDNMKLDEYMTSIRDLESQLQRQATTKLTCTPPARPAANAPLNYDRGITPSAILQANVPLFLQLMAAAFQCDITRSITFMLGNGTSNNDYAFLFNGQSMPHHGTSHHGGAASKLASLTTIDTWEMTQVSTLLQKLDSMTESDGQTILDHTTFYLGSDIGDGQNHNHWDMPVIIAGGASGKLKLGGQHVNYTPSLVLGASRPLVGPHSTTQTGQAFISILNAHGMMQQTFGMATGGPLTEIMA
jgi:Protein of unknown function (DUF1552)